MIKSSKVKNIMKSIESAFSGIFHPRLLLNLYQYNFDIKTRLFGKFCPQIPKNDKGMLKNVIFQISKFTFWYILKKTPTYVHVKPCR